MCIHHDPRTGFLQLFIQTFIYISKHKKNRNNLYLVKFIPPSHHIKSILLCESIEKKVIMTI